MHHVLACSSVYDQFVYATLPNYVQVLEKKTIRRT